MFFRTSYQNTAAAPAASFVLLLLRLVVGIAFLYHGWPKIQTPFTWMGDGDMPGFMQALAALAEFGGGLALILGFLTPLASLGLACTMGVAVYTHAVLKGDPFVGHDGSYELAAVYLCISLLLLVVGPGRWSADARVFGR